MPRGGARPGSGPAPDPNSIREAGRLDAGVIRTLAREFNGEVPEWPLTKASARELTVWHRIWTRPQAAIWSEQGSEDRVAIYVRTFVQAERVGATAAVRSLMLRQENALLLSHAALLSAGFRVSTQQPNAPSTVAASTPAAARRSVPSSRGRLRAVEDVGTDN